MNHQGLCGRLMRARLIIITALLSGALAGVPWGAYAVEASSSPSGDRKAAARALFEEGLKLLEAEHWAAARDKFERARQLHASPRITYNLTTALVQLGRLVYASELLRELTTTAAVERGVQTAAESRLRDLRGRIGSLNVTVDGDRNGLVVELDGRPFDLALLDVPTPVDPGEHTLAARRDGETLVTRTVSVREGERASLHVAVPARPVRLPPATVPPITARDPLQLDATGDEALERGPSRTLLWVGLGLATIGGAVATWFLLSSGDPARVEGNAGTATLRAP